MKSAHSGERFYAFALSVSEGLLSIQPIANSVEGLRLIAEEYVRKGWGENVDEEALSLEWSDADWPYRGQHISEATAVLQGWEPTEATFQQVCKTCQRVLADLDSSGLFGKDAERDQVMVLVLPADPIENDVLRIAKALNPPAAFARFASHFDNKTAGEFTRLGKRNVYETNDIAFSRDGGLMATCGRAVFVWSTKDWRMRVIACDNCDTLQAVAFAEIGVLAAGGWRGSSGWESGIHRWDVRTGHKLPSLPGHREGVHSLSTSADGQLLASAGCDEKVRIWSGDQLVKEWPAHDAPVRCVRFSPTASLLATSDRENAICLWDCRTWNLLARLPDWSDSVSFSPCGNLLATARGHARDAEIVHVWDVRSCELVKSIMYERPVESVAFSPDGNRLAVGGNFPNFKRHGARRRNHGPARAEVLDLRSNEWTHVFCAGHEFVSALEFMPGGQEVVVTGRVFKGPPAYLWRVK